MVTFKGGWSKLYYTQYTLLNNIRQLPFFFFFGKSNTHTHKGEENDYFNGLDVKIGNKMSGALLRWHSQPEMPSYSILPSQKATSSIIPYHFTTHLTSQLLFSYSTH